jgi:folate-dependent phosphoribosylglycinamide formyltransferase PurN
LLGVIANHSAAKGLEFARLQGIPAYTIEHQEHVTRESFDAALIKQIDELGGGFGGFGWLHENSNARLYSPF